MAFKMKGFDPGKGTGMSPKTMKKGSSMKMKKESSMKKPLVGDQHKLPQELKAAIKAAPMKLGMRDPNMAMKASNNMLPGSMMAMKANRSAMTLKKGDGPKFKTKSKTSVGTKESAKRKASRAAGKMVEQRTKRTPGAKFDIKKAAAEKAKQKKLDKMPSPMTLEKGMVAGAAMAGGAQAASEKLARRKRTGDPKKIAQRMRDMKKRSVNTGAAEGAAEAASEKLGGKMEMRREVRKNVSPNKMGHSPKKMKKESAMSMKARAAKGVKKGSGMTMKKAMSPNKKMTGDKDKLKDKVKRGEFTTTRKIPPGGGEKYAEMMKRMKEAEKRSQRTKKPLRKFTTPDSKNTKIGEDSYGNKFISRRRG